MDMKERKLTVVGEIDPVIVVGKLRKNWPSTHILSVGPAKEPEKKKEDGKKEDGKKEDGKKDDGKKKDPNEQFQEFMRTYGYRAPVYTPYYAHSIEENPNTCVIS